MLAAWVLCALAATDGGFFGPPGKPTFQWDVPQVIADIDIPDRQVVNGIPLEFHAVVSKKEARAVFEHLVDSFRRAKLYIPPAKEQVKLAGNFLAVTAYDPAAQVSYTAILQPNPEGTTTVILGHGYLGRRQAAPTDFAPLFPNAQAPVHSSTESSRRVTFEAKAKPAEVLDFYRQVLGTNGYTAEPNGRSFRRGQELLEVDVRRKQKDVDWTVVLITQRQAPPDDPF